jgi:hypothetical protein
LPHMAAGGRGEICDKFDGMGDIISMLNVKETFVSY